MSAAELTPTPEPQPTPEPTPTPTPEPQPQAWLDGLDTDLKSNPTLQRFADVPALARSYLEVRSTIGNDKITLPGKDAKPEEWDQVYNRLGRPETVEGYELSEWKPPEGLPWDPNTTSKMIEKMHGRRLTKEMAHGVLDDYAALQAEVWNEHLAHVEQANEQTLSGLRSKWGAAFETKMENGKNAAKALVGAAGLAENPFEMELPDGRKVGDLPGVVEIIVALGEQVGIAEDGSPGLALRRMTHTPDEAQRKLDELLGDQSKFSILMDATHPQHKILQELKTSLEKEIHGA